MEESEKAMQQSAAEAQHREQAGQELSLDEIHDILYRFDGFDELLAPLAEDLDKFSPEAEAKKKRYLQDNDLVNERAELRDRVAAFLDFMRSAKGDTHKDIRNVAQEKLDKNEELISTNLATILKECRDLERTYREIETFYRNAAPQKVKNITLVNVNEEALLDADSNLVFNAIDKIIMDEARSVDQRAAYATMVIPGLWKSDRPKDIIERYTKLAGEARMSFLTDFADADSVADAIAERESKRWQGITGAERHHSKLILMANHMILRGAQDGVEGDEELRGSVAMAVAGKMYSEKVSQPIMGEKHGSLTGSQGLSYRTVQDEVTDMSELGLNAAMNAFDKDMVYDSCTAFDGAELPLKRYPVVRTFDYVNRVLRHFLGKVTGQQLDRPKANQVRETIQEFLDELVEQKIISAGKVTHFDWNSKVPDRIDVNVDIQPLWAVRTFVYELKAADNKADSNLKEVK